MSFVLIVIPCLNEEAYIETLVRQMVAAPMTMQRRIVIADGGSTDGTKKIADALATEFDEVVYLVNPKRLQSAAVNLAVAKFAGGYAKYLIRLDAHADYPEGYCQALLDEAKSTDAASIVVAMKTIAASGFQKAVAAAQNSIIGNGGSVHRLTGGEGRYVDHGHHALMTIAAFTAVGGYDETFSHNEDAELDTRLAAAGYRIWLTGKTCLHYYPRATPGALFRQYLKYGSGRAATILKHRSVPKLRQIFPAAILPALLLALLSRWAVITAFPFLAWAGLCMTYGAFLAIKAQDPEIALAGPAAMIMHLGWSIGFWRRIVTR
jgi:succinoglycan biosynthesis protein ExoA